jgi:Uma2 family endonuclease
MSVIPWPPSSDPEYAWEVATLFPEQGNWSEARYLDLTDGTNRRIELVDGRLEFPAMPTELHQALAGFIYHALLAFVNARSLGLVPFPPMRLRISSDKIREPDVLFLRTENFHLRTNRVWNGADLVVEVVSSDPKDRQRDYVEKMTDYAEGNVAEYWIVDPDRGTVQVNRLVAERYELHGEFTSGQRATSALLDGFAIDVAELFAVSKTAAK